MPGRKGAWNLLGEGAPVPDCRAGTGCVRPEVFAKALGFALQDNGAARSDPLGCYRELGGGAVVGKGYVLGLVLQAFLFSAPPLILEQGAVPLRP